MAENKINIDANDLVAALTAQRDNLATEAAHLSAALAGANRLIAGMQEQLEKKVVCASETSPAAVRLAHNKTE